MLVLIEQMVEMPGFGFGKVRPVFFGQGEGIVYPVGGEITDPTTIDSKFNISELFDAVLIGSIDNLMELIVVGSWLGSPEVDLAEDGESD